MLILKLYENLSEFLFNPIPAGRGGVNLTPPEVLSIIVFFISYSSFSYITQSIGLRLLKFSDFSDIPKALPRPKTEL